MASGIQVSGTGGDQYEGAIMEVHFTFDVRDDLSKSLIQLPTWTFFFPSQKYLERFLPALLTFVSFLVTKEKHHKAVS